MDEASPATPAGLRSSLHADGACTVRDNGRGIPIDPASEVPRQIGAGSDPLHPPSRRQILGDAYEDLRRSARRRRLGRQRAVGHLGRGGARPHPVAQEFAAAFRRRAERSAAAHEPARHHRHASIPMPRSLALSAATRPPVQDGALQGLPVLAASKSAGNRKSTMATPQPRPASTFPAG